MSYGAPSKSFEVDIRQVLASADPYQNYMAVEWCTV